MDTFIKCIGLIAGLITIFNFSTGFPFNALLFLWKHRLTKINSSEDFDIETIYVKSGRVLNPPDKFSYKFQIPLSARGITAFKNSDHVWVILKDQHGAYFLQHPPVEIGNGEWRSNNIRPSKGIKKILWLKVDNQGNQVFSRRAENAEWGRFPTLPKNSVEVASAEMR